MSVKTKKSDADFMATLSDVADAAVARALQCLDDLDLRDSDAEHDRGARSAECLMRVATSAATLSARLQKEKADGENADTQNKLSQADLEKTAQELSEQFERVLEREGFEREGFNPEERGLSDAASGLLKGGRA